MTTALIGIDLGGTKIEVAALARGDGRVLLRERVPTPVGNYDATLFAIAMAMPRDPEDGRPAAAAHGACR
jgi:predicted NBD/HSP70 family sugar kinase